MVTTIYEVSLSDGRIFRIFCANRKQGVDFWRFFNTIKDDAKKCNILTNGIHTLKQFKEII